LRVERCNRARPVVISCCNQQAPKFSRRICKAL
jgi:hypothetical protein